MVCRIIQKAALRGAAIAAVLLLASCAGLTLEEAPLVEDQGRSPGFEGQFL